MSIRLRILVECAECAKTQLGLASARASEGGQLEYYDVDLKGLWLFEELFQRAFCPKHVKERRKR